MTCPVSGTARFVRAALAIAALPLAACWPTTPPICNCSTVAPAIVTVPAPQTTPPVLILSAWTDPPCSAEHDHVSKVSVTTVDATACDVGVLLSNGDQYSFSVEFEEVESACCPGLIGVVRTSTPELFDGGARDGA